MGNFAGTNPIYDPTSQTVDANNVVTRQPFPNNLIPAAMLDPVAMKIQEFYPQAECAWNSREWDCAKQLPVCAAIQHSAHQVLRTF